MVYSYAFPLMILQFFWVFFPFLTLKHWETNSRICFQKLYLETGNEKISFNALEKKKILGKKDLGEKFW